MWWEYMAVAVIVSGWLWSRPHRGERNNHETNDINPLPIGAVAVRFANQSFTLREGESREVSGYRISRVSSSALKDTHYEIRCDRIER